MHGSKRGPEPAHDIVKPPMLRLIGEKGDGWLPSYGFLQEGDLERGNRTIDDAAAPAGRDPREIRRLLNIPPDIATVERLLPLEKRPTRTPTSSAGSALSAASASTGS